jgi:CheY-like chemotaxis protein
MDILYIEDDKEDVELFQEALMNIDTAINLVDASTFSEALKKLKGNTVTPDAIFVDFHLPGLDGYECVRDLKASDRFRDIPIVLISSTITSRQVDEFNKLGVYYFLSKGALLENLQPALKVIIDSLCKGQEKQ